MIKRIMAIVEARYSQPAGVSVSMPNRLWWCAYAGVSQGDRWSELGKRGGLLACRECAGV